MTKINTGLLYHWYDGDNYDIDCDDDYITCMVVINLQHQTGPEAWNRGISWLIWLIIGLPPRATIHDNSEYFLTTETRPHFCFQSKREAEKGQLGGRGDNDNGQFQGNFPLQRPVIQACGRLRPLGSKDLAQAKCQKRQKPQKLEQNAKSAKKRKNWSKKRQNCPSCTSPSLWQGEIFACVMVDTDIWTEEVKILSYSGTIRDSSWNKSFNSTIDILGIVAYFSSIIKTTKIK